MKTKKFFFILGTVVLVIIMIAIMSFYYLPLNSPTGIFHFPTNNSEKRWANFLYIKSDGEVFFLQPPASGWDRQPSTESYITKYNWEHLTQNNFYFTARGKDFQAFMWGIKCTATKCFPQKLRRCFFTPIYVEQLIAEIDAGNVFFNTPDDYWMDGNIVSQGTIILNEDPPISPEYPAEITVDEVLKDKDDEFQLTLLALDDIYHECFWNPDDKKKIQLMPIRFNANETRDLLAAVKHLYPQTDFWIDQQFYEATKLGAHEYRENYIKNTWLTDPVLYIYSFSDGETNGAWASFYRVHPWKGQTPDFSAYAYSFVKVDGKWQIVSKELHTYQK